MKYIIINPEKKYWDGDSKWVTSLEDAQTYIGYFVAHESKPSSPCEIVALRRLTHHYDSIY
jgi:hypothetical protein